MAGQTQEPVIFRDVAVYLSRAEWDAMAAGQRELYRSVMLDNYGLLTSLGYPGPKPDILYRLERGEEPWVCASRSPARWEGPDSPPPGCGGAGSRLEEPPSGWWPSAGGRRVLEERTPTPCPGGRCVPWRLRASRLLSKFGGRQGGSEVPAEAAGGEGPVERHDRARTVSWPGKEEAAGDKPGVTANVTRSGGFPLGPAAEQPDEGAAPGGRLPGEGSPSRSGPGAVGEATFLQGDGEESVRERKETVWKDHCYCALRQGWLLPPLREHNYCRGCGGGGATALRDHEYCRVEWLRDRDGLQTAPLLGGAEAVLHRLAQRKHQIRQILRKAKLTVWRCRRCASNRLELAQGSPRAGGASERPGPPAEAEGDPPVRTRGAVCSPAGQEAAPPQARSAGGPRGATLGAPAVPLGRAAAPPAWRRRGATAPGTPRRRRAQRARLARSPDGERDGESRQCPGPDYVLLRDTYRMVLRTVDHVWDSLCHGWELGGCSPHKADRQRAVAAPAPPGGNGQDLPHGHPR